MPSDKSKVITLWDRQNNIVFNGKLHWCIGRIRTMIAIVFNLIFRQYPLGIKREIPVSSLYNRCAISLRQSAIFIPSGKRIANPFRFHRKLERF